MAPRCRDRFGTGRTPVFVGAERFRGECPACGDDPSALRDPLHLGKLEQPQNVLPAFLPREAICMTIVAPQMGQRSGASLIPSFPQTASFENIELTLT